MEQQQIAVLNEYTSRIAVNIDRYHSQIPPPSIHNLDFKANPLFILTIELM
jgi:hypothetical protein